MSEELGDAVLTLRTDNRAMNTGLNSAEARMKAFGAKARAAGLALTAGLTLPIVGIAAVATKAFVGFDKAMTGSLAIMGGVSAKLRGDMSDAAREMGRTTLFSAEQAAESYFFLASAGLDAATSIKALPVVARFAQAGLFDMALATDLLTDAQSALGLKTGDVVKDIESLVRVSDVLAKANQRANATIQQFSEALTNEAGAALKSASKDIEEGVAVLAAFADQGVKGQKAGSNLSRIMRLMGSAAVNNAEAMNKLGITVLDAAGNWLNFADIIESMEVAFDGMSDAQRIAGLESIGFTARVQGVLLPLLGTSAAIRQYEKDFRSAAGTTQEISDKQLESASAQWTLFKGALEDVLIVLGGALVPALLALMTALLPMIEGIAFAVDAFASLPAPVQNVIFAILGLLAALGPVVFIVGAIAAAVGSLTPLWVSLTASFAGPTLIALAASLGGILIPLALVAAAIALVALNWDTLEPIIGPALASLTTGLGVLGAALKETAIVFNDLYLMTVKPFFDFVMGNTPALVLALTAIGIAFVWAFPPFGIAAGIVAIIGAIEILKTRNDELGESALDLKIAMLELGNSFLAGAQAAKDAFLSGFGPLGGASDVLLDQFDGLDKAADAMAERLMDARSAAFELKQESAKLADATAFITRNMNALFPVMEGGDLAMERYALSIAESEAAAFNLRTGMAQTREQVRDMTDDIFQTTIEMLRNADTSGLWGDMVARAAANAGVSVDVYRAKLALATQATIAFAAAQAFLNSALSDVGFNLVTFVKEAAKLPALVASLNSAIGAGGGGGGNGDGIFTGIGAEAGEELADDLVPAFVRAMQAEEGRLQGIRDVIENAISARNIRWDDVARLYELGAIGVAEDFMDALQGRASEIGLRVDNATFNELRASQAKALFDQGVELSLLGRVVELSGLTQHISTFANAMRDLGFRFDKTKSDLQNLAAAATTAFKGAQSAFDDLFNRPTREAAELQLQLHQLEREKLNAPAEVSGFLAISLVAALDNEIDAIQRSLDIRELDAKIMQDRAVLADRTLLADQERAVQAELLLDLIGRESFLVRGLNTQLGLEMFAREEATTSLGDFSRAVDEAARRMAARPLLSFGAGGFVPGSRGEPQLVVAHAGEQILTPSQQQGQGVRNSFEFHITADSEPTERMLKAWAAQIKNGINDQLRLGDLSGNYVGAGAFAQV